MSPLLQRRYSIDDHYFTLAFQQYHRQVRAYFMRRVQDFDLADDLSAQTFFTAYQNRHRFIPNRSFQAWIYGIARIALKEYFRQWQRREQREGQAAGEDQHQIIDSEKAYLQEELKYTVSKYFQKYTTPTHRTTLQLHLQDEKSYLEIAHELQIAKGTVMSRLHRGIHGLKQHQQELEELV